MMTFLGRNPLWTSTNLRNLTEAGFQNCMTMFRCVTLLSKAAGGIPWQLFEKPKKAGEKRVELFEHPLLDTIQRPNPRHGLAAFIEAITGFYYIAGNAYILGVGAGGKAEEEREQGPAPSELYYLYPHVMTIIPGTSAFPIAAYKYFSNPSKPKEYPPEDILQLKTFSPLDDFYGYPPLKAAAKGIDILNMALHWNMKLLQNDMKPPGAIKVSGNLDPEERKNLTKMLLEEKAGYENASMPMVLEGAQEWMPFSINPKDADWINSIKLTLRFCCITLGIDPALMGDTEAKTYSNQKESRKALYEETTLPYMDYLRDELNNWLTPKFGDNLVLDYNRDEIEALKEERSAVFERASKAHWLTLNEQRVMCGKDELPIPEADLPWLPMNLVPITAAGAAKPAEEAGTKSDKHESFWQKKERKLLLWQHFVKRVQMKERTLIGSLEQRLRQQARVVREAILGATATAEINPEAIIDVEEEAKTYAEEYKRQYYENFLSAGEAGRQAGEGKLMDLNATKREEKEFEIPPDIRAKLEALIIESGAHISRTSLKKIAALVVEGKYENWTVDEVAQRVFERLDNFAPSRARAIARTEVAKTENWGQVEGYKQAPRVERKGWLCSFVADSRLTHQEADVNYSENPIPLNDAFEVGGELMQFPLDPSASVENIVNCLCSTYPEVREA